jgi:transcription elongation factor Elf1
MNDYELIQKTMGCPECGGKIELYNTNPEGTGGQYRCLQCGRDTSWAVRKALSASDVVNKMVDKVPGESRQPIEAIRKYLAEVGADGHSILKPEVLIVMGFDKNFVTRFTERIKSGKSYKEQIFDSDGRLIPYLDGVYALRFLYGIANNIGADTSYANMKTGRGFQAQELVKSISAAIN